MPTLADYMAFKRGKLDQMRSTLRSSDSPPAPV